MKTDTCVAGQNNKTQSNDNQRTCCYGIEMLKNKDQYEHLLHYLCEKRLEKYTVHFLKINVLINIRLNKNNNCVYHVLIRR